MDIFPANQVQNLKNKLTVTSLIKSIDNILKNENNINSQITNYLIGLKGNQKLYKLNFNNESQYISELYSIAVKKFQGEEKVSSLSYGLAIIFNNLYLYIKKDIEESLNYLRNYDNICPIDFNKYMNLSKTNVNSEMMLKGGLNIYGYSFEFNINYFLQTLSDLIELPNLIINLSPNYKFANYSELDIAYYNQNTSAANTNMGLLKCNIHLKIHNNKIDLDKNNIFELYENSLILGEIKTSFPKKLNKSNEIKGKEESLETIIDKLFNKLNTYYELYHKIGLFNTSDLKNIQIIFFYDNVQIDKINAKIIIDFIKNNNSRLYPKIPIHFYIVYTIPAITNVSIYDLKRQLTLMKDENRKRDEEIKCLKETNRIVLLEIEKLKKIQGVNIIEDYNNNITFQDNNLNEDDFEFKNIEMKIDNRNKKLEIEGVKNNQSKENNEINPISNNIFNFVDDFNKIQKIDTDKKRGIEGVKINESKENNEINPIDNNIFNFVDDFNKIQIKDTDKKMEIEDAKINNQNKENNDNIPEDSNIFNFIDRVIDKNNKENNEKEKKFNDANEIMEYFFSFQKNKDNL